MKGVLSTHQVSLLPGPGGPGQAGIAAQTNLQKLKEVSTLVVPGADIDPGSFDHSVPHCKYPLPTPRRLLKVLFLEIQSR